MRYANGCGATRSNGTNGTCGIEVERPFQGRRCPRNDDPGLRAGLTETALQAEYAGPLGQKRRKKRSVVHEILCERPLRFAGPASTISGTSMLRSRASRF